MLYTAISLGRKIKLTITSVTKEIQRINQRELERGLARGGASWHDDFKDTSYVFIGNLDFELSEGDVICVFSQFVSLTTSK